MAYIDMSLAPCFVGEHEGRELYETILAVRLLDEMIPWKLVFV